MAYTLEQQIQQYLDQQKTTVQNINDEISLNIMRRDTVRAHVCDLMKIMDGFNKDKSEGDCS